jgi:hypothetical protein
MTLFLITYFGFVFILPIAFVVLAALEVSEYLLNKLERAEQ